MDLYHCWLLLLLLLKVTLARTIIALIFSKPVHPDEAVVEHRFCTLYCPLGLIRRGKLD